MGAPIAAWGKLLLPDYGYAPANVVPCLLALLTYDAELSEDADACDYIGRVLEGSWQPWARRALARAVGTPRRVKQLLRQPHGAALLERAWRGDPSDALLIEAVEAVAILRLIHLGVPVEVVEA